MSGKIAVEAIKFGAVEGAKKLVIFGLNAKDVAIGVGMGVAGAVGGSKICKLAKTGIQNMKAKADQVIEEAKKEKAKKDAEKEAQK